MQVYLRNLSIIGFIITVYILMNPVAAVAKQNEKERLQRDKIRIEQEIEYTNKLLQETQCVKQTSMN